MGTLNTAITAGVKITVRVLYRDDISHVETSSYFFNYEILIENHNDFTVQLLHRNWYIFDSLNEVNFISGEGVVGEKPTLGSGGSFQYVSGCELYSEVGYMKGHYTFLNIDTNEVFQVAIPQFNLEYPGKMN